MLNIDIRTNFKELQRGLNDLEKRQIPFAAALAVNELAGKAKAAVRTEMESVFDRPVPFTLNSTYVKKARKGDLTAWIGVREFAAKGTPAWKYLTPETVGGPRRLKRFERRLSDLSGGQFVLPGRGARLNQYGNISPGQLGQLMSGIGALADVGENISPRRTAKLRRQGLIAHGKRGRSSFFVARSKRSKKPIAVYQLKGRGRVVPIVFFSPDPPTYSPRFDFAGVVIGSINRNKQAAFERALAFALATAK